MACKKAIDAVPSIVAFPWIKKFEAVASPMNELVATYKFEAVVHPLSTCKSELPLIISSLAVSAETNTFP